MRNDFLLAAAALLAATPAFAQQETEPEQPRIREVYARETNVDMDGAVVIGKERMPEGRRIEVRKGESFDSMIEERVHFKRDLAKSIRLTVKTGETATTK